MSSALLRRFPSSTLFMTTTTHGRRAMISALRTRGTSPPHHPPLADSPPTVVPTASSLSPDAAAPQIAARPPPAPKVDKPRPKIRSTRAALMITPTAVKRLRALLSGPTPQLIRIGVRNKGCAGLSYHLDYVDQPGKFDEVVEQDGVRVLIDSKALFSIIGSEMDWLEDQLSSKFTFQNPNIKDACGCGESFTVQS
ncbi:hypothetical protein M378DRAFT_66821 [Amanita muscaria Koide BX008]|uniref:Iron-sulfur assembly protein 1 n=1 Tax=Amanita muscaria (strain Koide BX008) TaxID=946122 RepID=A0A0C2XM45_AMAMK|nr:hypothetical protein M378DRAFT_66821 [Amanita muscaria Koide BX008]